MTALDPRALEAALEMHYGPRWLQALKAGGVGVLRGQMAATISTYLSSLPPAPAGSVGEWVLVPREPTKEMIDAGLKRNRQNPHPWCPAVYRAMIAASPTPPAPGAEHVPVAWQNGERELAHRWAASLLAKLSTSPQHADDCLWLERLAALFAHPVPPVRVKQLEWHDEERGRGFPCYADTILGRYTVWDFDGHHGHYCPPAAPAGIAVNGDLKAAKAAAQADYEKRILSALEADHD